jgi:L-threonylcarbamoyladenylate synthase
LFEFLLSPAICSCVLPDEKARRKMEFERPGYRPSAFVAPPPSAVVFVRKTGEQAVLMTPEFIEAYTDKEHLLAARRVTQALHDGSVVVFPTETVYGVAARVTHAGAMERLRQIKGRALGAKPFSVHIGQKGDAWKYVNRMPPIAERLIRKGWPGPLALVLPVEDPASTPLGQAVAADLLGEMFFEGTIGLRCPDDPVTTRALAELDQPVVAASANRPGNAPPSVAKAALAELQDQVDLIIDTGATRYTKPSTIVKVSADGTWELLRTGVLDERAVRRLASTTILLLCSGNTCRSPMAEALCKQMLAEKLKVPRERLGEAGYEIVSAGVGAVSGIPASGNAVEACRQAGADLAGHRSRPMTGDLLRQADRIWTMCEHHTAAVLRMVPEAKTKVDRLDPERDIQDPAGSDVYEYVQCMQQIRAALEARFREMMR